MRRFIIALPLVVFLFTGCYKKDENTSTCDYDPCAVKAPSNEITQLEAYLSGAGITTAIKYCSGMYYQIISTGSDKAPSICSYVSVNYKGTLTNGTVFDQTSGTPAGFQLAILIESWKQGILLIKKGGKIRLYVPPSLGYGTAQSASIPANSILIFDIELVDIQ